MNLHKHNIVAVVGVVLWIMLPVICLAQSSIAINTERQESDVLATQSFLLLKKTPVQSLWAIKTNLLYWAALTPNIEVERYIGSRFTVNVEVQFAWWSSYSRQRYYQLFAASPELRYRFAQKGLFHGHFIGLYAIGGYYDFMFDPKGYGYQGEVYFSPGISYGYIKPIGRNLSLEFSIGIGYLTTPYRRYEWTGECYERQENLRSSWIGPTKAKIVLVWQLGKKGGRR